MSLILDQEFEVTFNGTFRDQDTTGSGGTVTFNALGIANSVGGEQQLNVTEVLDPGAYEFDLNLFTGGNQRSEVSYSIVFAFQEIESEILYWNNTSGGQFSEGDNWNPPFTPTSADSIAFDILNTGYVVDMDQDAEVRNATVEQGTVSWRFNGNAGETLDISNDLTVGTEPNIRAGLDIIGGSVTARNIHIGTENNTDALVTLREGADLSFSNSFNLGGGENATAQLFVVGSGTRFDVNGALNVGQGGTWNAGSFIVGNQEETTFTLTDTGRLLVDGTLDIGLANPGIEAPQATLNMGAGGTLEVDSLAINPTGFGFITGDGTSIAASQALVIQQGGRLLILEGARLTVGSEPGTGDLTLNSRGPTDDLVTFGVDGEGSAVVVSNDIYLGRTLGLGTAEGELIISDGGQVIALGDLQVGSESEGNAGILTVTDAGSTVESSNLMLGNTTAETEDGGESLLAVRQGGEATVTSDFMAYASGSVEVTGAGSTFMVNQNAVFNQGSELAVTDQGQLSVGDPDDAESSADFTLNSFSEIFVEPAALVSGEDANIYVTGNAYIGMGDDGERGQLDLEDGGTLTVQNMLCVGSDSDNDSGRVVITGAGSSILTVNAAIGNDNADQDSTVFITDGGQLNVAEELGVLGTGELQVGFDAAAVIGDTAGFEPILGSVLILPNGRLYGDGSINVNIENLGGVNNFGLITPGTSPGTLSIDGDFTQADTGTLVIEIAGTEPGTQFDVLSITGSVDIEGTVVFRFLDGFAPSAGQQFEFIAAGGAMDLTDAQFMIENLLPGFDFTVAPEVPGGPFVLSAVNDGRFVPEPASLGVLLIGGLLAVRRRR